jgi:hypothetical protein
MNRHNCTFTLPFFMTLIYIGGGVNLGQEFGVFSGSSEFVAAEFTNNASSDGHYEDTLMVV